MKRFERIIIDLALLQSIAFYLSWQSCFYLIFNTRSIRMVSRISVLPKNISRQDFGNAINGYWGPLLSWLLAPFLAAGLKPLLAVKLLSIIIGLVAIIQSNELIKLHTNQSAIPNNTFICNCPYYNLLRIYRNHARLIINLLRFSISQCDPKPQLPSFQGCRHHVRAIGGGVISYESLWSAILLGEFQHYQSDFLSENQGSAD